MTHAGMPPIRTYKLTALNRLGVIYKEEFHTTRYPAACDTADRWLEENDEFYKVEVDEYLELNGKKRICRCYVIANPW